MKGCKFFAILLAMVIIFSTFFMVSAESETNVNHFYAETVNNELLLAANDYDKAEKFYENIDEVALELRKGLEAREATIIVGYSTSETYNGAWFSDIFHKAIEHTGVPTQGDYLAENYKNCGGSINYTIKDSGKIEYSFVYNMDYLTTAQQESELDTAIDNLLQQLNLDNASDYKKVRTVYDYMCENITYDYDGLANGSLLSYTAYSALINKTSVCQGYATLFYRLMLELGIDARVISGTSRNQAHGWNIVKLNGVYYNLDSTWDATRKQSNMEYDYFLKGDNDFNGHSRDEEFLTTEFYNSHPMAQSNHNLSDSNGWTLESRGWAFYENGLRQTYRWKEDTVGWCFLDESGYMKTNAWVEDSAGWCYVGANGYCITNSWAKDSIGWIWLNDVGSMTKSSWLLDGGKWYWLDENGYMSHDAWRQDSVGWVYLGSDGAMMTNAWVEDSVGWCYVGDNGYAVTNCWKKDSIGWCYLNSNGSMVKSNWIIDKGKWYYLDENGYMVTGWKLIAGILFDFALNGEWVENP